MFKKVFIIMILNIVSWIFEKCKNKLEKIYLVKETLTYL